MDTLSNIELNTLYKNFAHYRDFNCNGWAKMTVNAFYDLYKLNPYTNKKGAVCN